MKQAPTQPNTTPPKNKENNNQVFQNELLEARKRQKEKKSVTGNFTWLTQHSRQIF